MFHTLFLHFNNCIDIGRWTTAIFSTAYGDSSTRFGGGGNNVCQAVLPAAANYHGLPGHEAWLYQVKVKVKLEFKLKP